MKYKLVDLQGQGGGEKHIFKSKREVWEYLVDCFKCSGEIDNPHKCKLGDLLEFGSFELITIKQ